jgi:hypothetical protein
MLKGLKTYRHKDNPKEKELHDKFIEQFSVTGMSQIVFPVNGTGFPEKRLTEEEQQIMLTTIQWLGSPVGQGFLRNCGFELKEE